jgi:cobalt-zinc-cadmium resistance protein CzcA
VASVIPLAFLFAIIMLRIQGLPANLISMGALDFGLLLEGTLVIVEVIFVAFLQKPEESAVETLRATSLRSARYLKEELIKKSAGSVASHIFFAQLILVVALFPIFSFQKVEGKMFSPLAFTLGYAFLGSLILSLTYVPVMCKVMLTKPLKEKSIKITRLLTDWLASLYNLTCRYRKATIIVFIVLFSACLVRFMFWGTEFIPSMNEGAIYVRATLPNSVNLDESVRITKEMKARLQKFDEIDFILSQTGRPNDGTDATGFFNIEFHTELKPEKEWKRKISKVDLINQMQDSLAIYPGIILAFSQPIQDNVEEYVAGVKSALVIKIFGNNLNELEAIADKTAGIIKNVRGIEDVNVFRSIGLPELQIKPQEAKMARYAVSMADAQAVIEMAIGGKAATTFYENERTFDVMLRFEHQFRSDEQKIGDILIPTMDNKLIPLKEIADIEFVTGPAFIYREGSSRYVGVGFSIRDRDLGSTIAEAKARVETLHATSLHPKIKIVWAGEFESQQRATKRLAVVVPAVLFLILFLLYTHFGKIKDVLIAASTMPYAFIGGFISLWVAGIPFGISAGVGFIILFGIVSINSILLISLMKSLLKQSKKIEFAINEAVRIRMRAILMISLMGSAGLFPAALSTGMGSEVQKPLAVMIVGGMLICLILSFTVLPQVFYFVYRRKK